MELPFSSKELESFFRFALLLTGSRIAAESALSAALMTCAGQVGGYRNDGTRKVCVLSFLREECLKKTRATLKEEVEPELSAFANLPEPERSALALFYSCHATTRQIAAVLKIDVEELGEALGRARERLPAAGMNPTLEKTA